VEDWLKQVEEVMLKSVRQEVDRAFSDYIKVPREKWILNWAGQAVLAVSVIYWTIAAEEAMKKNGLQGLTQFYDKLQLQMNATVGVVRTNITKL